MTMRLLVSVRDLGEALLAARAGADLIDCKEPGRGALGGLDPDTVAGIVAGLKAHGLAQAVSATIGDLPMQALPTIVERVDALGRCGVTYVKVGIERAAGAHGVLQALARCGPRVVPVFIADRGLDDSALALACRLRFPAVMVDTADKHSGSLFDCLSDAALGDFVGRLRGAGVLAGVAGALRIGHADALARLAPDFAGFRSAACRGGRQEPLDAACLHALVAAMRRTGQERPAARGAGIGRPVAQRT